MEDGDRDRHDEHGVGDSPRSSCFARVGSLRSRAKTTHSDGRANATGNEPRGSRFHHAKTIPIGPELVLRKRIATTTFRKRV